MIEQKDNDELTAAYLAGCHDTRKAYEQRLAEAESKISEFEALPEWVKAGDGTLHGAIDYWQERANDAEHELNMFRFAVEHVTENGNTKRSFSASEGWAMVHTDRLTDLLIMEERFMKENPEAQPGEGE